MGDLAINIRTKSVLELLCHGQSSGGKTDGINKLVKACLTKRTFLSTSGHRVGDTCKGQVQKGLRKPEG